MINGRRPRVNLWLPRSGLTSQAASELFRPASRERHYAPMVGRINHEKKRLTLPDGSGVVLLDMLAARASSEEMNRNVHCIGPNGTIAWRIEATASAGQQQRFTKISLDDQGLLRAYNWNGGEYLVDLATGAIGSGVLVR